MAVEYADPPAAEREDPAQVPKEDECTWKNHTVGEEYEDDIDPTEEIP